MVRLGTKCPSMTSTWSQSVPGATRSTASDRLPKSADRIDGATRSSGRSVTSPSRVSLPVGRWDQLGHRARRGRADGSRPQPLAGSGCTPRSQSAASIGRFPSGWTVTSRSPVPPPADTSMPSSAPGGARRRCRRRPSGAGTAGGGQDPRAGGPRNVVQARPSRTTRRSWIAGLLPAQLELAGQDLLGVGGRHRPGPGARAGRPSPSARCSAQQAAAHGHQPGTQLVGRLLLADGRGQPRRRCRRCPGRPPPPSGTPPSRRRPRGWPAPPGPHPATGAAGRSAG